MSEKSETPKPKKIWYRLDNAALIFPAVRRPGWNNVFRMSATLSEPIDTMVLERAVADIKPRFPTFFVSEGIRSDQSVS